MKQNAEKRTVICLIGTLRALDITHVSLIENVILPLNADLLICMTRISPDDESSLDYFKGINIIDTCFYDTAEKNYEERCDLYAQKIGVKPTWRKHLKIQDNWLGGLMGREGSGMHLTYNYWKLQERIQNQAPDYDRYVITRTDLLWMSEHPPLELMDPGFIWLPTGEDYGGYNDRHAICSLDNIYTFLSPLKLLIDSTASTYLKYETYLNHESHMKIHLDYSGIKVARFKNISYLTGNKKTPTRWSSVESRSIDGCTYNFKYITELTSAIKNSSEFKKDKNWNEIILPAKGFSETVRLLKARIRYKFYKMLNSVKRIG